MPYLLYHGEEVIQFIDGDSTYYDVARSTLELFRVMVDENPASSQTRYTNYNPVAHVISPEEAVRVYGYQKSKQVMQNLIDWYSVKLLEISTFNEPTVRLAKLRDQARYNLSRIVEGDLIENDLPHFTDAEIGDLDDYDEEDFSDINYVDEDFRVGEANGFDYNKPNKPGEKFYNAV